MAKTKQTSRKRPASAAGSATQPVTDAVDVVAPDAVGAVAGQDAIRTRVATAGLGATAIPRRKRAPERKGWPCRYLGCGQTFVYRQSMSRHMKKVHGQSAKHWVGPRFEEEMRIVEAFTAAGSGAEQAVEEVLYSIPTFLTLAPGPAGASTSSASCSPIRLTDFDDADETAADVPDDLDRPTRPMTPSVPDSLASPPPSPAASYSVLCRSNTAPSARPHPVAAASAKRARTDGRAWTRRSPPRSTSVRRISPTQPSTPVLPSVPTDAARRRPAGGGKDLRTWWALEAERRSWPKTRTAVSHVDVARTLDTLPAASSAAVAKLITEHFDLSRRQAFALRRRAAAMVEVEQLIIAKVRRLLPRIGQDLTAALAACQRISDLCDEKEQRPTSQPFE